jgi:valyl-tRNA synthetase
MSKSLDNVVDPVPLIKEYGADAVRMSLIVGVGPGNDNNFSVDKTRAYKKFANKLWNIARFILERTENAPSHRPDLTSQDASRIEEFDALSRDITNDYEQYRLYLAGEKLYHYIWHTLADVILEERKTVLTGENTKEKLSAQWTLLYIFSNALKLLHPLMPFVTEEIWGSLPNKETDMIMVAPWPSM